MSLRAQALHVHLCSLEARTHTAQAQGRFEVKKVHDEE